MKAFANGPVTSYFTNLGWTNEHLDMRVQTLSSLSLSTFRHWGSRSIRILSLPVHGYIRKEPCIKRSEMEDIADTRDW